MKTDSTAELANRMIFGRFMARTLSKQIAFGHRDFATLRSRAASHTRSAEFPLTHRQSAMNSWCSRRRLLRDHYDGSLVAQGESPSALDPLSAFRVRRRLSRP